MRLRLVGLSGLLLVSCGGPDAPPGIAPPVIVATPPHPCPALPDVAWPCTVRLEPGPNDSSVYFIGQSTEPHYSHPCRNGGCPVTRVFDSAGVRVYVFDDSGRARRIPSPREQDSILAQFRAAIRRHNDSMAGGVTPH